MSVGGFFPRDYRLAQVRRQLHPGAVIKLYRRMDDGQLHEKRFVVVHVAEHTLTCVVKSRVSEFILRRPELVRCQVAMPRIDHDFMDRDSHIDCSRLRRYATDDVLIDLCERPEWVLGEVSAALRVAMAEALRAAPTLSRFDVDLVCRSLLP